MKFGYFLLKRLLLSIFVIFGLSILIFVIARVVPGEPARMALGPQAPEAVVQRLRQEMHLDKSLLEQYFIWVKDTFSGNFGRSLITKRLVLEDIKEYLPATMELVIFAGILMVIFAILLGTLAAQFKDTWVDGLVRVSSYFGIAIPAFVAAIFFMLLFGYYWPILPVLGRLSSGITPPANITGLLTLDSLIQGNFVAFWDAFKHLILPSVALSLGAIFQEARITRSSMVDNMRKDFLSAERGYGIPERVIMFKYLLKPSLIPTVSVMGLDFAFLFGSAFLVETIFNWPGISRYGINAMLNKDLSAISAVVIIFGTIFVVVNIIVDIIVAFLDPRVRLSTSRGI
ncbi:MAG: ABC transporter permease subunit [Firmicutes bacterium]|jgi:peptide/nickel transport system permease protein|nr:ABC transporter permease subunit [Bacillota bacterium]